ncbi:hypothetical protein KC19_4G233600 [Ceratodon purpureus]|uniref:Uncharacterized protein n=1 Tax=Ceratodon purpureus TaxID=3225 RepID=A0A8T0IEA9_CERPU|nr:hypothetical protein KC19_4G233600 [Ceratodon purpureus]
MDCPGSGPLVLKVMVRNLVSMVWVCGKGKWPGVGEVKGVFMRWCRSGAPHGGDGAGGDRWATWGGCRCGDEAIGTEIGKHRKGGALRLVSCSSLHFIFGSD